MAPRIMDETAIAVSSSNSENSENPVLWIVDKLLYIEITPTASTIIILIVFGISVYNFLQVFLSSSEIVDFKDDFSKFFDQLRFRLIFKYLICNFFNKESIFLTFRFQRND